jgi:hypothetical protein
MVSHGEGSSNLERRANEPPECAYKAGTNIRIQLFFFGFHTLMKRAVRRPPPSGPVGYRRRGPVIPTPLPRGIRQGLQLDVTRMGWPRRAASGFGNLDRFLS